MTDSDKKITDALPESNNSSLSRGNLDVLQLCQKIKFLSADLHHFFSDIFQEERDTLLFWKRTALEEENNAKEFELIAKLRKQNVIHPLRIDPLEAEITIIFLQTLLERLKNAPPDAAEALRIAIKVEEKITPFHLENIVTFADPSFLNFFSAAINADHERIDAFRKALGKMGGR